MNEQLQLNDHVCVLNYHHMEADKLKLVCENLTSLRFDCSRRKMSYKKRMTNQGDVRPTLFSCVK